MNQTKLTQSILITVIVACVFVSGYFILKPNNQPQNQSQDVSGLAPMVNDKQVLAMTVKTVSYEPNSFKVKAGVPVRWEITSSGQPSCDSGQIIANGLVDPIYLNPGAGEVAIKEFTPQTAGTYKFSCPMGMVRGTIEVIN